MPNQHKKTGPKDFRYFDTFKHALRELSVTPQSEILFGSARVGIGTLTNVDGTAPFGNIAYVDIANVWLEIDFQDPDIDHEVGRELSAVARVGGAVFPLHDPISTMVYRPERETPRTSYRLGREGQTYPRLTQQFDGWPFRVVIETTERGREIMDKTRGTVRAWVTGKGE